MKTIKKVTALLLSMVLLLSFITAHAFAVDDLPTAAIQFLPHYRYLTCYFTVDDVVVDSYAFVRVNEYYVNDCDMEATTRAMNPYVGDIMDTLYTHAAYVHLYAEFESGFSGELDGYDDYAQGESYAEKRVFACQMPGVDDDDYLTSFTSTHKMYFGIRYSDFEDRDRFDQVYGSNTITIYQLSD